MISPVTVWRRQNDLRSLIGKNGRVITWTRIMVPVGQFKKIAPYAFVLVEMEDNTRMSGMLVDSQGIEPSIGMEVITVLRKVRDVSQEDVIPYGVKFKPLYETQ